MFNLFKNKNKVQVQLNRLLLYKNNEFSNRNTTFKKTNSIQIIMQSSKSI